jgi:transposase
MKHTKLFGIRAREAAKTDQQRARQRLGKFLLRQGKRPAIKITPWTAKDMKWIKRQVHFDQPALEATLLDYVQEVDHAVARIERLEKSLMRLLLQPHLRSVQL